MTLDAYRPTILANNLDWLTPCTTEHIDRSLGTHPSRAACLSLMPTVIGNSHAHRRQSRLVRAIVIDDIRIESRDDRYLLTCIYLVLRVRRIGVPRKYDTLYASVNTHLLVVVDNILLVVVNPDTEVANLTYSISVASYSHDGIAHHGIGYSSAVVVLERLSVVECQLLVILGIGINSRFEHIEVVVSPQSPYPDALLKLMLAIGSLDDKSLNLTLNLIERYSAYESHLTSIIGNSLAIECQAELTCTLGKIVVANLDCDGLSLAILQYAIAVLRDVHKSPVITELAVSTTHIHIGAYCAVRRIERLFSDERGKATDVSTRDMDTTGSIVDDPRLHIGIFGSIFRRSNGKEAERRILHITHSLKRHAYHRMLRSAWAKLISDMLGIGRVRLIALAPIYRELSHCRTRISDVTVPVVRVLRIVGSRVIDIALAQRTILYCSDNFVILHLKVNISSRVTRLSDLANHTSAIGLDISAKQDRCTVKSQLRHRECVPHPQVL